jgi:hypothetical protein
MIRGDDVPDAGVGDEEVDRSQLARRLSDHRVHRHPFLHIARQGEGGAAVGSDLGRQSFEKVPPSRDERDLGPSRANRRASSRPMPLEAPVTSATL